MELKTIYKPLLTLVVTVFVTISTYAQQENIIGTWILDYNNTILSISGTDKEKYDAMDADRKSNLSNFYMGRQCVFNADGTYVIANQNNILQQGNWSVSEAVDKLYLSAASGENLTFAIGSMGNNLILSLEGLGSENVLLKNWHLVAVP